MDVNVCPVCGSSKCTITRCAWYSTTDEMCAYEIECINTGLHFIVHDNIECWNNAEVRKRYNLICSLLLQKPFKEINGEMYPFKFFCEEETVGQPIEDPQKINLANNIRDYPKNIISRVEKSLINISKMFPVVGEYVYAYETYAAFYFCESENPFGEIVGILSFLCQLGYCEEVHGLKYTYIITVKGWEKIHELTQKENEVQQGFIAMSFRPETSSIWRIFAETIRECGYHPQRIDQKEHNNQIVPEIFFEIKRSKFLVVDVTYPNFGAYYEAGYGEALNKQVIVCCRREEFESKESRPHFDIAQKSTVVWEDEEDLKKKLYRRIEATVGLNK